MRKDELQSEQDNYSAQELFVESETTCCLCGHDLSFKHEVDFSTQKIVENTQCPGCHIKAPAREHNLH